MPHTPTHPPRVPPAPITDTLLEALIRLFNFDPDQPLTEAEASMMFQATPGCLEELLRYRRLLGRRFASVWPADQLDDQLDGELEAANVIHLPANRRAPPERPA